MRLEGAPAGNDCGRVLVACAVGCVRQLLRTQPRWARTRGKGRGRVGPGADSLCGSGCGRKCFERKHMGMAWTDATGRGF
jgi:hypothetical protein